MSVRALLADMRAYLRAANVPEATCGTVEIVLAEALNNVVEHAYDGVERGEIGLHARLGHAELVCTLSDRGAAMRAPHLPEGRLPEIGCRQEALPEGGFGWFLIRSLTRDIHYTHDDGGNRLTLWFDLPGFDRTGV